MEVRGVGCHVTRSGREQGWGRAGRLRSLSWIPGRSGELVGAGAVTVRRGEIREEHGRAGREGGTFLSVTVPDSAIQGGGLVPAGVQEVLLGGSRGGSASVQAGWARVSPHWLLAFSAGPYRCRRGVLHLFFPLHRCQGGQLGSPECQAGRHSGGGGREGGAALYLQHTRMDSQQSSLFVPEQSTGRKSSAFFSGTEALLCAAVGGEGFLMPETSADSG